MIVIDEEHEGSYKSGTTPRYHARQVAMYRVAQEGAVLLMGSATPSLEAWHHMREGTLTALRLPDRLSGGSHAVRGGHRHAPPAGARCPGRSSTRSARPMPRAASPSFS